MSTVLAEAVGAGWAAASPIGFSTTAIGKVTDKADVTA